MNKPFISLIFLLIFLSVACSLPIINKEEIANTIEPTVLIIQPTAVLSIDPTQTVYSPPTARPTSNETPSPVPLVEEVKPTEISTQPAPLCSPFMKEEFDNPGECWPASIDDIFSPASISNKNKIFVQVKDGHLEFESQLSEDVFLYSFYKDNEYDEVIVRASVTKIEPSANQNGFTLACHVNRDGWYEVRIESSGTFEVFQYDAFKKQNGENPYVPLGNGGAAAYRIGTGRENIIEWQCRYESLTLIINDKQTWIKEKFTSMKSGGGVGVGLASYSGVVPRHIGFDFVEILEP
ncbi:MAG: hypothetical protein CVU41_08715 [Chloroflexi bacterium HGW-Chloroflexi-3]|nr:MAG: hypothetical protein CVU41_08715 [Chloroflexi bacterium HGW-Chloroflexi-3]